MAIEVKDGKYVPIAVQRASNGVLENEEALLAVLIIMDPMGDRRKTH